MVRWLALVVGCCLALRAQAVEAALELPENLPVGTTVEGRVKVMNGAQIESFQLPDINGLTLEQTGNLHSFRNENGRTEESLSILLRAEAAGEYRIPAVSVRLADHSTVATAPLTVSAGPGNPRLIGNAYAATDFSPDTIVPGETATLRYRLYLRVGVAISSIDVKPPEGLTVLGGNRGTVRSSSAYDAQGEQWLLYVTTWQVTADQPGTIDAGGQQSIESRRGRFQGNGQAVAVRPGRLTVLSLPTEGRPADFAGLVGPIEISAQLERERISAGEGTALRVVLRGPLAARARAPQLPLPHGLRAYAKETHDQDGERTFAWDLVPAAPGTYAIPPVSLAYFDVERHAYRRAETPPLTLTVLPGRIRDLGAAGPAPTPPIGVPQPAEPSAPIAGAPAPLRGGAASEPPALAAPLALIAGIAAGLIAALAPRRLRALKRPQHRGRRLAESLAAGRLDEAAAALELLRSATADPGLREDAARLHAALDAARFGGHALPDSARALARRLEALP